MSVSKILNGGWLAGRKTYVAAGVTAITGLAAYATGEANLMQTIEVVSMAVLGATLRHGIARR